MKQKLLLLTTLFSILLLAACNQQPDTPTTAVADTGVNYVPFSDETLGLALVYPEDWTVRTVFGGLTVASNQSVIDANSLAELGENGFVNYIPGELGVFNLQTGQNFTANDALIILGVYKQLLEREGQTFEVVEPGHSLDIEAQSSGMMVLKSTEDGESLITILAVIINEDYVALISAASLESSAAAMRPIFDHIIESTLVSFPVLN
ncbi:MAG: hypothetical protein H6667_02385 [Ardenticatenaceae bacterium]|nr:hypothetical protein [Ardenticatenaceae bacterium]MCB9443358.1 hypothetical protein [Ardenticatenaceae bacterium]